MSEILEQAETPPAGAPAESDVAMVLQKRGIDPGKLEGILNDNATTIKDLKQKAKAASTDAAELAAFRKAKEESEAANLTEIEAAKKAQAAAEKAVAEYEAKFRAQERNILLERSLTESTRGMDGELAGLFSEYVRATVPGQEWDTAEDLDAILKAQHERWSKLQPAGGGGAIPFGVPGSPQGGSPANVNQPVETGSFMDKFRKANRKS